MTKRSYIIIVCLASLVPLGFVAGAVFAPRLVPIYNAVTGWDIEADGGVAGALITLAVLSVMVPVSAAIHFCPDSGFIKPTLHRKALVARRLEKAIEDAKKLYGEEL